jgi:hypothetical protein
MAADRRRFSRRSHGLSIGQAAGQDEGKSPRGARIPHRSKALDREGKQNGSALILQEREAR